jgi:hypothetical protein
MIRNRHFLVKIFQIVCVIILIFLLIQFLKELIREYMMSDPLVSSVAFWQDNRTYQTGRPVPLPTRTIEQVNLTNLTLVITACCRDVESHLIGFQKNIRAIGALFRNYRLYLGESDSTDGTMKFIRKWAKDDPDHVDVYSAGQQRWRQFFRK